MTEHTTHNEVLAHDQEPPIYSKSILSQSIPSLLISLVGFTIAGIYLEEANGTEMFLSYPLLMVATCILSFKGNIELIFAMHLSSISNVYNPVIEYARFAIDNSCMVVVQSIMIGLSVGVVGMSVVILRFDDAFRYAVITLCSCLVSCLVSTLVVLLILLAAVLLFKNLQINPDNVVLPSIAAFSDYFTVLSLIFFFKLFHRMQSVTACATTILLILVVVPFIMQVSRRSPAILPIQSLTLLVITFVLSSISGMLIEYFSLMYPFLASSAPVFCGLTGSTSFIYLNRKLTSLYTKQPHNKKASLFSLLIISLAMSLTYIIILNTLFERLPSTFSFLFIVCFLVDVLLLIEVVDYVLSHFQRSVEMAGVVALPVITSTADFFGSSFLVGIVLLMSMISK
ncbi:Mg2+ Transporter-E (MgtE) Family [Trachipleistophora hominis]|uniref:Mg2+ Transporter-E (MgtE) Family n=1 Tax=Trachipleistophora hominis TaxID=72359 RepID=L7JVS4_TRAHO|nr:Mg2+ Transporter-E (MgtE) Family [Trachipleistophora hominis]